ncbi:MAG: excisionase [Lachnospiraceae bacterium]|nr:excisionase [Lachnospiraceae bacterium]MDY4616851.1 excisionase [Lachnospiraceae bacterium]
MTETQEDTELKQPIQQMPWWNKYTFSVQETSEYFGFSDKKIRKLIDENEDADFILWNGSRPRIKRKLFEQFVDEKLTAI